MSDWSSIARMSLGSTLAVSLLAACSETSDQTGHQHVDGALTIERIYESPSLSGTTPRSVRFSPAGDRITFLQAKENDDDTTVYDLWAMDVADGNSYQLVDSRVLAPEERALSEAERQQRERSRTTGVGIVSYQWDSTGDAILVPLDGDVFYIDVESSEATRLMETEAFETDIKISPEGGYVSFIRNQDLWIHDLSTGEERALTTEGAGVISWGMAEFVAQEEMSRSTGYWWSPDDRYVIAARVDESPVDVIDRLEIGANGNRSVAQRYPRAGTDNAFVDLYIIDIQTGGRTQIDLGEETDIYMARVNWANDSEHVYVQRQNREQTVLDVLQVDIDTGASEVFLTEQAPTWINLTDDFRALEDGGFLWTSERTGYRHIYHVDTDGNARQITNGDWVVDHVDGLSSDGSTVYFTGWMEDPLQRHLYSVPFDGSAEPTQITEGEGRWSASVSSQGFIGSFSNPRTPTQVGLYNMDGELISWIEENPLDETHPYYEHLDTHIYPEYGTITAADSETTLYYQMFKPDFCTADNPCPAIVSLYGGPHVQIIHKGWTSSRDQVWAQNGYVIFKLDNRGSWNRGHAFEAELHDVMGTVEAEDQLAGLDFLQAQDYVDGQRVGVYGWSYGGYLTLMTTLQAPGRFAAAISGAPVTDWALYDTHYTERYMDTPENNPEGYEQGSAFAHVDGYETPTLIIHGMADDNVLFDNTTSFIAELQQEGHLFELMTYPGQRHGIRGQALGTHLNHTMLDFWDRHLAGE